MVLYRIINVYKRMVFWSFASLKCIFYSVCPQLQCSQIQSSFLCYSYSDLSFGLLICNFVICVFVRLPLFKICFIRMLFYIMQRCHWRYFYAVLSFALLVWLFAICVMFSYVICIYAGFLNFICVTHKPFCYMLFLWSVYRLYVFFLSFASIICGFAICSCIQFCPLCY